MPGDDDHSTGGGAPSLEPAAGDRSSRVPVGFIALCNPDVSAWGPDLDNLQEQYELKQAQQQARQGSSEMLSNLTGHFQQNHMRHELKQARQQARQSSSEILSNLAGHFQKNHMRHELKQAQQQARQGSSEMLSNLTGRFQKNHAKQVYDKLGLRLLGDLTLVECESKPMQGENNTLTLGDLQGNLLFMLKALRDYALVTISDENYGQIVKEIMHSQRLGDDEILGVDAIKEFHRLVLASIERIDTTKKLRLIGDVLCDRLGHDGYTLACIAALLQKGLNLSVMFSNHDLQVLPFLLSRGSKGKREGCQYDSAKRLFHELGAMGAGKKAQLWDLLGPWVDSYVACIQLVEVEVDTQKVHTIYTHAPVGVSGWYQACVVLDVEPLFGETDLVGTLSALNEGFKKTILPSPDDLLQLLVATSCGSDNELWGLRYFAWARLSGKECSYVSEDDATRTIDYWPLSKAHTKIMNKDESAWLDFEKGLVKCLAKVTHFPDVKRVFGHESFEGTIKDISVQDADKFCEINDLKSFGQLSDAVQIESHGFFQALAGDYPCLQGMLVAMMTESAFSKEDSERKAQAIKACVATLCGFNSGDVWMQDDAINVDFGAMLVRHNIAGVVAESTDTVLAHRCAVAVAVAVAKQWHGLLGAMLEPGNGSRPVTYHGKSEDPAKNIAGLLGRHPGLGEDLSSLQAWLVDVRAYLGDWIQQKTDRTYSQLRYDLRSQRFYARDWCFEIQAAIPPETQLDGLGEAIKTVPASQKLSAVITKEVTRRQAGLRHVPDGAGGGAQGPGGSRP